MAKVKFNNNQLDDVAARSLVGNFGAGSASRSELSVADGKIVVGNAEGIAAVTVSGDATMSNTGAVSLAADCVDSNELVDGSVDDAHLAGSISNSKLTNHDITFAAGAGIAGSTAGDVDLGGTCTIAVDGPLEDLDDLGVVDAADKFIVSSAAGAYSYETAGQVRTTLGLATDQSPTFDDLTLTGNDIVFSDANAVIGAQLDGKTLTLGQANTTIVLPGNLTVAGSLDTVNATELNVIDLTIECAVNAVDAAAANGAGFKVGGAGATLVWDNGNSRMALNKILAANSFVGDVAGNADTATTLETSRAIALSGDLSGTADFNGSAGISIAATIQANAVEGSMINQNAAGAGINYLDSKLQLAINKNSYVGATGVAGHQATNSTLTLHANNANENGNSTTLLCSEYLINANMLALPGSDGAPADQLHPNNFFILDLNGQMVNEVGVAEMTNPVEDGMNYKLLKGQIDFLLVTTAGDDFGKLIVKRGAFEDDDQITVRWISE